MFLPLLIRHDYERRPLATWGLAILTVGVHLFFLAVPGWLIDLKRSEVLGFLCYNPEGHLYFQFLTYAFLYANPFLMVLDVAALLFFGMAVEARLGWWRFLLLYLPAAVAAALAHKTLAPHMSIAGGTGALFGVLGAAVLIFGFSETEGFAFFVWPFPPKAVIGTTAVPTIFVMAAYAAAVVVWEILTPIRGVRMISLWGLGGGFLAGALCAAAMLRSQIPILHPRTLDPSRVLREEERRRREQLARELAEGGLLPSAQEVAQPAPAVAEGGEPAEESLKEEPVAAAAGKPAGEKADAEAVKLVLAKLTVMKDATELAAVYADFMRDCPGEILKPASQFVMAKLLADNFHYAMALDAYERLVQKRPDAPMAMRALLEAGKLCARVPEKRSLGLKYLERFLQSKPPRREIPEAERALQELRDAMALAEAERVTGTELGEVEEGPATMAPTAQAEDAVPLTPEAEDRARGEGPGQGEPAEAHAEIPTMGPKEIKGAKGPSARPEETEPIVLRLFEPTEEESEEPAPAPRNLDLKLATDEEGLKAQDQGATIRLAEGPPIELSPQEEEGAEGEHALVLEEPSPIPIGLPASAAPAPGAAVSEMGKDLEEGLLYTLIIEPKTALNFNALLPALSEWLNRGRPEVEDLIRRRKGIVLRDLQLNEAREIRDRCRAGGQSLRIVAQTPELDYPRACEAEAVRISEDDLEWLIGPNRIRAKPQSAALLSAGRVRVRPGASRARLAASVYFRVPRLHIRIWESTLRRHHDPSLAGLPPSKAFTAVCLGLAEVCSNALLTSGFRRLFDPPPGAGPLEFYSETEFDDYNTWNLLAAFGRQPEDRL